eukprot:COSAG01_NODE_49292_length_373_cov_1.120438_1_plen_43_part_01
MQVPDRPNKNDSEDLTNGRALEKLKNISEPEIKSWQISIDLTR